MPFLDFENSSYGGKPVILYEFRRGGLRLLYAQADRDVTAGSDTYKAIAIANNGVKQKGDGVSDTFEVLVPNDTDIALWFRYTPPSDKVWVVIRRFHYGEPEAVVAWLGSIVSTATDKQGQVTISCQPAAISLRRDGLRLAWQRGCPHALYDQNCRADKTKYAFHTTIAEIHPNYLWVPDLPPLNAAWAGGFLEFEIAPGTYERRLIGSMDGASIYPFGDMDGYTVGLAITLYPGCLRTSAWCDSYFDNYANYGGFPFMPNRTPYNGDPVF